MRIYNELKGHISVCYLRKQGVLRTRCRTDGDRSLRDRSLSNCKRPEIQLTEIGRQRSVTDGDLTARDRKSEAGDRRRQRTKGTKIGCRTGDGQVMDSPLHWLALHAVHRGADMLRPRKRSHRINTWLHTRAPNEYPHQ